jgi:hypothetical protein
MEAWQFFHFFQQRYKSPDSYVKGKVNEHSIRQGELRAPP